MTSSSKSKRAATYVHSSGKRLYHEVNGASFKLVVVCDSFGSFELIPTETGGRQLTVPPAFQAPSPIFSGNAGSFSRASAVNPFGLLNANYSAAGQTRLQQFFEVPDTTHVTRLSRDEVLAAVLHGFLTA